MTVAPAGAHASDGGVVMYNHNMYKRILLKISGEQLSGKFETGIDPEIVTFLANEIKKIDRNQTQLVIIIGGGNMVRGEKVAGHGIKRATADQMGMLSGLINSMAITDIFESQNLETRCLSNIFAQQVAESYSFRLAEKHLARGKIVIIAGGIGRPYFTHDTAAVNLALELNCECVLKSTKVDGVYDKDPIKFPDAKKLATLTFQQAVENTAIKVMDKAALGLAMEHKQPVVVFDLLKEGNIARVIKKEAVGTLIQ
jgi:uridylate kinase